MRTGTDRNSFSIPVSGVVASSATSSTVGTTVSFGISNVMPAAGKTPRLIASINARLLVDNGLITSPSCGVGIKPALFVVLSSAAITYWRASLSLYAVAKIEFFK